MQVLVSTVAKEQFKMYLEENFISSLNSAAERFNRRSGQQIAEEVLQFFFPYWERIEQAKVNRIAKQGEQLLKDEETVPAKPLKPAGGKKGGKRGENGR